jgi:crossover junction endodeoxyribonuclease RusA
VTFYLPLPERELTPNARCHWAIKAKVVKTSRAIAKAEALRVLDGNTPPKWQKANLKITFFLLPKNRGLDPDNAIASIKPYIDGIADAGVIKNDKNLWPERPTITRVDSMPRVELEINHEPLN